MIKWTTYNLFDQHVEDLLSLINAKLADLRYFAHWQIFSEGIRKVPVGWQLLFGEHAIHLHLIWRNVFVHDLVVCFIAYELANTGHIGYKNTGALFLE